MLLSVQYLRAAAAIAVVVHHTGLISTLVTQSGVDLFFVISGFIMMLVTGDKTSPSRFIVARAVRIVPLYWAVTMIAALLLSQPPILKLAYSLFFWPDSDLPVLFQGWSLNLEMSYYNLFALTLFSPPNLRFPFLAIEIGFVCLVLPGLLPPSVALSAWSSPFAFEFLAGAGLHALWRHSYVPVGLAAWLIGAGGLILLVGTHFLGGIPTGWMRAVIWGGEASAIVAAGLGIEAAGQLPRLKLLEFLGQASYAIYLTHFIAICLASKLLDVLWTPFAVSFAIVWACLIGSATHLFFERPVLRITNGLVRTLWPKPQTISTTTA
jgi:exopolysaccharide production protein ExoZ